MLVATFTLVKFWSKWRHGGVFRCFCTSVETEDDSWLLLLIVWTFVLFCCNCVSCSYECDCSDTGFEGDHCEIDIPECASDPCQHGATCLEGVKGYTCLCWPGTKLQVHGIHSPNLPYKYKGIQMLQTEPHIISSSCFGFPKSQLDVHTACRIPTETQTAHRRGTIWPATN